MILGVLSDTHGISGNVLAHIALEFQARNVEIVIHAGDISESDIQQMKILFGNLPVICALTDEQVAHFNKQHHEGKEIPIAPGKSWTFTQPGKRIVPLANGVNVYVGHKRGFRFLYGSIEKLIENLNEIQRDHDNVRFFISGHTHRQVFFEGNLIDFLNPGAIADSPGIAGGHEFAIIDTDNRKVIFSRIPLTKSRKKPLKLAVISDSFDISQTDPDFWPKLAEEFRKNKVTHIIHCGNMDPDDIGLKALKNFQIYFNDNRGSKPDFPANWHLLKKTEEIGGKNIMNFEIEDYWFSVQLELGASIWNKSESDLYQLSLEAKTKYPEVRFIFCGISRDAFLEEGQNLMILNPGDIFKDRDYALIELPRCEITFGHIPTDPLPEIA